MGARDLPLRKTILHDAYQQHPVTQYIDYCKFLESIYLYIKNRQKYSYQDFSCDLGFGESTYIHQIVRRYRSLTAKNAEKIAGRLEITGKEKRYLLSLVKYSHARSSADRDAAWKDILKIKGSEVATEPEHDILDYFSQWFHPVVREYLALPGAIGDPQAIAKNIVPNVRPEQVRESLDLLERLNLIRLDPGKNRYEVTSERVSTGHRVKSLAVVNYHLQMINLARDALAHIPGKERDISALTLSVSEESFERIRGMIHAFQLQLMEEAEKSGDREKVIQLNIQMFPVSKTVKSG